MNKGIIILGERKGKRFTIDLSDSLQTRYELVRELALSRESKAKICSKYGYSRASGYIYEKKWKENRWKGLMDKPRGPKRKSKRTPAVESEILALRFHKPDLDMYEITDELKEKGVEISPRTVARVLAEHGVVKKTKLRSIKS